MEIEMKRRLSLLGPVAAIMAVTPAWAADQHIRLTECPMAQTDLHALAMYALENRDYNIEENTPAMLVGEQDGLKVEILLENTSDVVIRWKEGFGHKRDLWLRNLKTDMLWKLAE
jgi:hypothetical protein